jgi:4'-phosphopantetheinyl transferase
MSAAITLEWTSLSPGAQGLLAEGQVHLWRIDLDEDRGAADLSAQERARADSFRFGRDRARFISGRAALRRILAGYAGGDAASLPLARGVTGKPSLLTPGLSFNFSRTKGLAVAAIAAAGRLGVDIETVEAWDFDPVAREQFSTAERLEFEAIPPVLIPQAFFRGWTGKEALVKATGDGLNDHLCEITLRLDPRRPAELLKGPPGYGPDEWRVIAFEPEAGVAGALALDCAVLSVAGFALAD